MSDETTAAESEDAAPPPPRKAPRGVVLIGALVGGLVAGAAAGLFAVGPMVAKRSGYAVSDSVLAAVAADSAASDGEHAAEGEHAGKEGEAGPSNLHLIDNLVLNPAGSGGTRFLMVAAAVEFKDAQLVEQFKARDAEVRDLVLRVMGARSVEQLADMTTREALRREIADSLVMMVPKAARKQAIRRVFFPQFVIQ
ncbi:MAG: flagellar basal body-associated FliL family protein [Gemmatimonadaceae bacterium]